MQNNERENLRNIILSTYNINDLRLLAFDLNINFEELAGDTISTKIISLIFHACKHNLLEELKTKLVNDRPQNKADWGLIDWTNICAGLPSSNLPTQSKESDKLFSKAMQLQILGNLGEAHQILEYIKSIDPFYPSIDIQLRRVKGELEKQYVDEWGQVDQARIRTLILRGSTIAVVLVFSASLILFLFRYPISGMLNGAARATQNAEEIAMLETVQVEQTLDASDPDLDGLSNREEAIYQTEPDNPDTDEDNLSDGNEVNLYKTDPLNPDTDADGLSDGVEVNLYKTDPLNLDTDGDGLTEVTGTPAFEVCSPPSNWVPYVVLPGDTVSSLALTTGTTIEEILNANCFSSNQIWIGETLFLPNLPPQLLGTPTLIPLPLIRLHSITSFDPPGTCNGIDKDCRFSASGSFRNLPEGSKIIVLIRPPGGSEWWAQDQPALINQSTGTWQQDAAWVGVGVDAVKDAQFAIVAMIIGKETPVPQSVIDLDLIPYLAISDPLSHKIP